MEARLLKSIEWRDGALHLIDQRGLPDRLVVECCEDVASVARAIAELRVRGAPAIGVAAAYGIVLAANQSPAVDAESLRRELTEVGTVLKATRPTAVNLAWAVDEVLAALVGANSADEVRRRALETAERIAAEDLASCHRIGALGAELIPPGASVLTHCNAGGLATTGFGTALGVIRAAYAQGRVDRVLVDETRPVLQGARLTAWELKEEGIPATLIADGAAAHFMARGRVQAIVVGADRIAANGDVANKIGTYGLAVLAKAHGIPFYVAAPFSTIDLSIPSGDAIPIEERGAEELTFVRGQRIAPEGVEAANPAFDVTPARYVTALVTDRGVVRPPFDAGLTALASCSAGTSSASPAPATSRR